ncbi:MAG: hypothetical protein HY608_00865 [Planctomycetes bacterium]|nr:hypothetical protein [Planctomycetota bacterium]
MESPTTEAAPDTTRYREARDRALAWLVARQHHEAGDDRGAWGVDAPMVGFTALALTAIAKGDAVDRYPEAVQGGVDYLLRHRRPNGAIYNVEMGNANYMTSCAIMALVALDRADLGDAIRQAATAVASGQVMDPTDLRNYGGFGYEPAAGETREHPVDLGNTAFALDALHAAEEAGYFSPDRERMRAAESFLTRLQNRSESNPLSPEVRGYGDDGGFMYRVGESKAAETTDEQGRRVLPSYGSMTYEGLLSFLYAGVDKDDARVLGALGWIRDHYTTDENPGLSDRHNRDLGQQGLYYYLHAFSKAHLAYGHGAVVTPDGVSHDWAAEMGDALLALQQPDGYWKNDHSPRWMEGDTTYATSLALLALQNSVTGLERRGARR